MHLTQSQSQSPYQTNASALVINLKNVFNFLVVYFFVTTAKGCPEKSLVGFSSMTRRNRGTVFVVICWAGFVLEGPAFIYCDGVRWRNEPRCVPQNAVPSCSEPPRILNARMTITQGGRGVSYTCSTGFTPKLGYKTLQCNSDGQWIGDAAVCARKFYSFVSLVLC